MKQMNTFIKTGLLAMALIALAVCKNEKKDTQQGKDPNDAVSAMVSFNDGLIEKQFNAYFSLKDALVGSNFEAAQRHATTFMEVTEDQDLSALLAKVAKSSSLEEQRTLFAAITEKMTLLTESSLTAGTVYQQFCPMAFENKGGYWLALEPEINNPYYGDRMLRCGRVTQEFDK